MLLMLLAVPSVVNPLSLTQEAMSSARIYETTAG